MMSDSRPGPAVAEHSAPPAARRLGGSRWRDPRVAVGVVLVAGSVVLGSQMLASADDTTPVWAVQEDVAAGTPLSGDSVQVDHVRLADGGDAALYLPADQPFPADLVAAHDLVAGELVSRSDARPPEDRAGAELPVAVQDGHRPPDLTRGDRVDVWVAPPESGQAEERAAKQVLSAVEVLSVDAAASGLGGGSGAVVLLGLGQPDAQALPVTLAEITSGTVVLVRVDG